MDKNGSEINTAPKEGVIRDLDTAFIVGTGINENAWGPVLEAINEHDPAAGVGDDAEAANFYFARHVYALRFAARFKSDPKNGAEIAKLEATLKDKDRQLKNCIARHLAEATRTGNMRLREEFIDIYNEGGWGRTLFITANWDMLLEEYGKLSRGHVLHVHGDIESHELLYLPSEITSEPYRSEQEHEKMGRLIATTWSYIAKAPKVVIYGLSLSALDAELGNILNIGLGEHTKDPCEVVIYNCQDQLERVERRVRMLLAKESRVSFKKIPLSCGKP
jgi:hypothetical protein